MSTPPVGPEVLPGGARLDAWVTYLSGPLRGRSVRIEGAVICFAEHDGELQALAEACDPSRTVTLQRSAFGYRLLAPPRHAAWVNGERVDARALESGDLIELESGPVLLFRIGPPAARFLDALRPLV